MKILEEGKGELIGWRDPDENREWVMKNKSRELKDKTMTAAEAVRRFVNDGDFIVSGGFGHIRVSMPVIHEIIRQKKRHLAMAGKTAVLDLDLLIAAGCVDKVEVAYSFGYELRGLAPASRRAVESGKCKVVAEISNAAHQWRFLGGMMGVPFIAARNMMGTDTLRYSSAKVVEDPFTKRPITLIPSAFPDVAFIHVHRCDRYGNAQIDGILIEDFEIARSARRLIVTTEEIVHDDVICSRPSGTQIPFYCVDAIVKQDGGAHPCLMPYNYYFDEEHIAEWLECSKTEDGVQKYMEKYILGTKNFDEYLTQIGGKPRLGYLSKVERMEEPLKAPWIK